MLGGRAQHNAPLAPFTWFHVGGPAELLVRPADAHDLARFLRELPLNVPVHVIGACSNLIIRDGGLAGVTIRLARGFSKIAIEPDGVIAGAAALDVTVAETAAAAGLTGLEFLCGIPGTIGGAVAMNGGAYGGDIASALDWAELVTREGVQCQMSAADLAFAYRHARLPHGAVVTRARLRARTGVPEVIAARMAEIRAEREASQPIRARTGGSTFRNPEGMKAWELIEAAGCRGLTHGGAQVSEKHCNFLINTGNARAADIEELGEEVRRRVLAATGVNLEWEIRRIGTPLPRAGESLPPGSDPGFAERSDGGEGDRAGTQHHHPALRAGLSHCMGEV
ncbi:MAG: UDP-N-acetylmuramate dehydrogenase [Acetobacteraceae bacterium]|nr:UDP-N-acetylmuramate dehydrogenase [Acetobacteraceae bacterium]